jgi:LacI family transcriptional regulator
MATNQESGERGRGPAFGRGRPTLKTIAALTGLGVTTVSRALKDGPELSAETKARVRAVAAEVGYRPDRAGVRLRTGRTFVIGLILDQNDEIAEFARRIIIGISGVLRGTPYHLVVMPQFRDADPMDPIRYVLQTQAADGVIFTHTRPLDPRVSLLQEWGLPFVTHGRTELPEPHPFHDYDNRAFAALCAGRLIERGRRRLVLVRPPREFTYHRHMVEGFHAAASAGGAAAEVTEEVDLDTSPSELRAFARRLARRRERPDGLICGSEVRCVAMLAGLQDAGLAIGTDIDVIAKQTSELLDHFTPAIDSYGEDLTFAGEEMARFLLRRIGGAPVGELQSLGAPVPHLRTPARAAALAAGAPDR